MGLDPQTGQSCAIPGFGGPADITFFISFAGTWRCQTRQKRLERFSRNWESATVENLGVEKVGPALHGLSRKPRCQIVMGRPAAHQKHSPAWDRRSFERPVRPMLRPEDDGKFVARDVERAPRHGGDQGFSYRLTPGFHRLFHDRGERVFARLAVGGDDASFNHDLHGTLEGFREVDRHRFGADVVGNEIALLKVTCPPSIKIPPPSAAVPPSNNGHLKPINRNAPGRFSWKKSSRYQESD